MLRKSTLMSIKGFWYIENDNNLKRLKRIYWDQRSFLVWQMDASFRWYPGWGARQKIDMSRPFQTESVNVQNFPEGKCLCPDFPTFKIAYVKTFVCSKPKIFRCKTDSLCVLVAAIMLSKDLFSRLRCVQNCLCPDFWVFPTKVCALQNLKMSKIEELYCANA